MKDLIDMLRDAENARGQYSAWAAEDHRRALTAKDRGDTRQAERLETQSRDHTRRAEAERQRAENLTQRVMDHFNAIHQRSFHSLHQPTEYAFKDAAE
jgi:hypothetical protein